MEKRKGGIFYSLFSSFNNINPWKTVDEETNLERTAGMDEFRTSNSWYLIKQLAISDFKVKYKNSVIGYLWSLLVPLLMLATLYVVFSIIMKLKVEHYQLFLLLGILLWNFFGDATRESMHSLKSKENLLKKINFSKRIIVLSSCLTSLFTLGLNMIVFFIFMVIFKVSFSWTILMFLFYLINLIFLVLGFSFGLSALNMKYRDISHIWEIFLIIGFWITPIIYPITQIDYKYIKFYLLNPMARIIDGSRDALIFHHVPNLFAFGTIKHLGITLLMCIGVFIIGYAIFKKRASHFAEEV